MGAFVLDREVILRSKRVRCGPDMRGVEGGRWTRNQFIGAISKTKMLIGTLDGLSGAGPGPATFKPSSVPMSNSVFETAPIN